MELLGRPIFKQSPGHMQTAPATSATSPDSVCPQMFSAVTCGWLAGGFILVPALLLLYPREQPTTITTISLAVVCCNALSGTAAYVRLRRVDYRTGMAFAAATVPGSVAGVFATGLFRHGPFDLLLDVLLVALALWLVLHPTTEGERTAGTAPGLTWWTPPAPATATPTAGRWAWRSAVWPASCPACSGSAAGSSTCGDGRAAAHPGAEYPRTGVHRDLPLRALLHRAQWLGGACDERRLRGDRRVLPLAIGVIAEAQFGAALSSRIRSPLMVRLLDLILALALAGARLVVVAL